MSLVYEQSRRRSQSPTWTLVRCRYMTQATWKHTHSNNSSSTSIPLTQQKTGQSENTFSPIVSLHPGNINYITQMEKLQMCLKRVCVCVRTVESLANRWGRKDQPGSEREQLHWWNGRHKPGDTKERQNRQKCLNLESCIHQSFQRFIWSSTYHKIYFLIWLCKPTQYGKVHTNMVIDSIRSSLDFTSVSGLCRMKNNMT